MRTGHILRGLIAPDHPHRPRTRIGVWWSLTTLAAIRDNGTDTTPVMFTAWPLLPIAPGTPDVEVWRTVAAAATITPDGIEAIAAIPADWGPARRAGWHRAATEAGVTVLRTVPAAEVILTAANVAPGEVAVAITALTDNDYHLAALGHTDNQTRVLAQHTRQRSTDTTPLATELHTWIHALCTDADLAAPPARLIVIGEPTATAHLTAHLTTDIPIGQISPLALAEHTITVANAHARAATPAPPHVPPAGVLSAAATAVLSLALAGSVIGGTELGYDAGGPIPVFSPGHLAVAAVGLAMATTAAAMLLAHWWLARHRVWDWRLAGAWLAYDAAGGLVAAGATGLLLASIAYVQARGPLLWTVLPTIAVSSAYAATGVAIHLHPDTPPARRLWPPMHAIALAVLAVLVIRVAEPLFAQMSTSSAFIARIGLIGLAAAAGLVLSPKRTIVIAVTVPLALAYLLTVSAGTGTVACVVFIAALTVRAAITLTATVRDQHLDPPGRSL
ncbi:hypothetical protein [Phytomonospora endophytica]|uniref:Uncharacterized protein n=1 Tax=Phytomonospora endophytica TaxID=714109 RepID=A0A841FYV8_9ACTN|nr:hypothetical protein [Phytomonospora endophytica]MBB6038527.1 hypothetical protein [Phytomonospora endophytica]GIG69333.1 hypothetical protein Pen01_56280 [Phytomonospora endophytica]